MVVRRAVGCNDDVGSIFFCCFLNAAASIPSGSGEVEMVNQHTLLVQSRHDDMDGGACQLSHVRSEEITILVVRREG